MTKTFSKENIILGHSFFFEWPLWVYVKAESETPISQIELLLIKTEVDQLILPVFTNETKAKPNVAPGFQLKSFQQQGFIKFLKQVVLRRNIFYMFFDPPLTTLFFPNGPAYSIVEFIFDNQEPWWKSRRLEKSLICVYCGYKTNEAENEEHVISEALGCTYTLYRGAVCNTCNGKFGEKLEQNIFNEPLMGAGQVSTRTPGKKKRVRNQLGKVVRDSETSISISGSSGKENEFVIGRAIAKYAVNIVTHFYGSLIVRQELSEIIEYVKQPKNRQDIWPFAAIYTPLGGFRGVRFGIQNITVAKKEYLVCWFYCPSGVFATTLYRHLPDAGQELYTLLQDQFDAACVENKVELAHMGYHTR